MKQSQKQRDHNIFMNMKSLPHAELRDTLVYMSLLIVTVHKPYSLSALSLPLAHCPSTTVPFPPVDFACLWLCKLSCVK